MVVQSHMGRPGVRIRFGLTASANVQVVRCCDGFGRKDASAKVAAISKYVLSFFIAPFGFGSVQVGASLSRELALTRWVSILCLWLHNN